jgi:hypothetical protein
MIEKIAYRMERISRKIPFLLIKPNRFGIECLDNDFKNSVLPLEKVIIVIEYIFSLVRQILGIRIAYIICGLAYILKKYGTEIYNKVNQLCKAVLEVDYINVIQKIYEYIQKNSSGILILVIIILMLYIHHYKAKISKYNFENIWKEEIEQNIKTIATAQKAMEQDMQELVGVLWSNVNELQILINRLDRVYKYDHEYYIKNNEICIYENFKEYEHLVINIKEQIRVIEENNGQSLYRKYNEKVWDQLIKLYLTDSDNKYYLIRNLADCDKKSIERSLDNLTAGYPAIRKRLLVKWANGVFCYNGIERYLTYIQRRKAKFERINMRLVRASRYSSVVNEVKDLLDK